MLPTTPEPSISGCKQNKIKKKESEIPNHQAPQSQRLQLHLEKTSRKRGGLEDTTYIPPSTTTFFILAEKGKQ